MFTCLFIRSCYVNPADKSPQLQLMFKSHMRMVSKCDVSDFDSAMFVGPRHAGLKLLISWDFHAHQSPELTRRKDNIIH